MMAAMMLPGGSGGVETRSCQRSCARRAAIRRVLPCRLTLVGAAVYAVYRPHGSVAAGVVAIAAGVVRVHAASSSTSDGAAARASALDSSFGLCCVGSSIGLMLVLVAVSS